MQLLRRSGEIKSKLVMNRRQKIDSFLADFRVAKTVVRDEQLALMEVEDKHTNAEEAQEIIQVVAQTLQQEAHDRIAGVVSRCLEAVFDEPYKFVIEFERKRGRTEAKLTFVRDCLVLDDPINQAGGGPVDVAAFALRLACLVLMRPALRKVLVLDEPFAKIRGKHYRERVRNLILQLADELDIQFILNIDIDAYPEFALGKVVEIQEC